MWLPNVYLNRSVVFGRLIRESVRDTVNRLIAPCGLPGFGLLTAPLRAAAAGTRMAVTAGAVVAGTAASTALLGGNVAASMGRSLARATPDVSALTRAAAGVAIEAIGGPPARRTSSNGPRRWIEVRGLGGEHAAAIAADVLAAVRATPGVRTGLPEPHPRAARGHPGHRAADGPSATELCRIVADAERRDRTRAARQHPASLPGDDALLMGADGGGRGRHCGPWPFADRQPDAAAPTARLGGRAADAGGPPAATAPRAGTTPRTGRHRCFVRCRQRRDGRVDAVADGGGRGGRHPHDAGGRGVERSADVVSA